jgi:hypothetical protein
MTSLKEFTNVLSQEEFDKVCPLNNLIGKNGNTKLPSSIAIWNMTSAHDCPSAKLGLCAAEKFGAKCYAKKSEYAYHKEVLPHRRSQAKLWNELTAKEFVSQFLLLNSRKKKAFTAIRFSESGDFRNQADVDKVEKIASLLKRFKIKCYTYTSRSDLDYSKISSLILSGSGFKKKGINKVFQIIKNKKDKPKGYSICKGDCKVCNRCRVKNLNTAVLSH